jgi:hypothetical protein
MNIRILLAAAALSASFAGATGAFAQDAVVMGSDHQTGGPTTTDQQTMSDIQARLAALRNQSQR